MSVLESIQHIRSWKSGDQRAPHKPLLMLYAISRLQKGISDIPFSYVKEEYGRLLAEFGPPNPPRVTYPFIRLSNDGIWEVKGNGQFNTKEDYSSRKLLDMKAIGSLTTQVQAELKDRRIMREVVDYLLCENFPETLHEDILTELRLDLDDGYSTYSRKKRDPYFRERILDAYERKCAICGYQIRRGDQLVGIEAAHIKWHQAGGPDDEENGIALCTLHHKLYDYGLFAIDGDYLIRVSNKANGSGLQNWLLDYHKKAIVKPRSAVHEPQMEYLNWQQKQVFKGVFRD